MTDKENDINYLKCGICNGYYNVFYEIDHMDKCSKKEEK